MIFRLSDHNLLFPDPELAEEDGLIAVGGDLSPQRLMRAYQSGIFPWYNEDPILWFSPHERFVLFPDKLKTGRHLRKVLKNAGFHITFDADFEAVIEKCSSVPRKGQDGTWINADMKRAYVGLHRLHLAHSVEVWLDNELVGGLYGVLAGNVFCGESMFSSVSNASGAALVWLCRNKNYSLIDCQIYSEHLSRMGAEIISRKEYMKILESSLT